MAENQYVKIVINNRPYNVKTGITVLAAARANGIDIPGLCFHPALKSAGSCRLCVVESTKPGCKTGLMLSCVLKVRDGLEISTETEMVKDSRKTAFRNLLQMAPDSQKIRDMAARYGVDPVPVPDGCIRCRLCIRVCKEVIGPAALKMEKREGGDFVVALPDQCIGCGTCAAICPTGAIRIEDIDGIRQISIRDEDIGIHPLETCAACGKPFITPKFFNHVRERIASQPCVKNAAPHCAACARQLASHFRPLPEKTE